MPGPNKYVFNQLKNEANKKKQGKGSSKLLT